MDSHNHPLWPCPIDLSLQESGLVLLGMEVRAADRIMTDDEVQ